MLLGSRALILLPECHIPVIRSGVMCISVNGSHDLGDVTLTAETGACTQLVVDGDGRYSFDVFDTAEHL